MPLVRGARVPLRQSKHPLIFFYYLAPFKFDNKRALSLLTAISNFVPTAGEINKESQTCWSARFVYHEVLAMIHLRNALIRAGYDTRHIKSHVLYKWLRSANWNYANAFRLAVQSRYLREQRYPVACKRLAA